MHQTATSTGRNLMFFLGLGVMALGLGLFLSCSRKPAPANTVEFLRLSREGKKHYDAGDAAKAIPAFEKASAAQPTNREAHLNLANAYLLANQTEKAIQAAQIAARLDTNSAAAHYLIGSALLRQGDAARAVTSLQQAKEFDRTVNAVSYQLGRAYQQLGNFEAAAKELAEVAEFEPAHQAAHYNLSQVYLRLGKNAEAAKELEEHQKVTAGKAGQISDPAKFERTRYTRIQVPFKLELPAQPGIPVTFVEAGTNLGANAANYRGPLAIVDPRHNGFNSLWVREGNSFRFLQNSNGTFQPGATLPALDDNRYTQALVGDLNNDKVDDVIVLGEKGSQIFKMTTNGTATDITMFAQFKDQPARAGVLLDLDYSGTLDLVLLRAGSNDLVSLRNLGQPYFVENATNLETRPNLTEARELLVDDWTGDDLLDVIVARENAPPLLLAKQRNGKFAPTNSLDGFPAGAVAALGDLNNDARPDMAIVVSGKIEIRFGGTNQTQTIPTSATSIARLALFDYDNDGWIDLFAAGDGLQAWRNVGNGFEEVTAPLGLDKLGRRRIEFLAAADLDRDCDTDLVVAWQDGGVQLFRNEGGNANHQLKLHLAGTKSNASGLGINVEVNSESLQLHRRVTSLPVEIGVGKNTLVDSLVVHWFDFSLSTVDVRADECSVLTLQELQINSGSCPFLYAWDGHRFRFVTDLLGAAPAGLPLSESRVIDADPEEFVSIGNERMFPARDGEYVLQVTEELREVLYLDQANLVIVDHPAGTEVHTTGKLLPGKPYPAHRLVTLHQPKPLLRATDDDGRDVTTLLERMDGQFVSPRKLRTPQLMGLAEPFGVTLDFGALPSDRPLALAITAWLRFGGGTVNVAAAQDPNLPFPFPTLEVETADGNWNPLDVVVGAPAGKTKNFIVDLAVPPGSRRLRLRTAFEIHWDRIALWEKRDNAATKIYPLAPTRTDLHWRGFSNYEPWPWYLPLTPRYESVEQHPLWRRTPAGWCTRYGAVDELIAAKDNSLALLNGGDELTLSFAANAVPATKDGFERDFFFYSVGWDKDADIHCVAGWEVEPLPWHGMDDQAYGRQARPEFPNDAWIKKYNTRWVGPRTISRATVRQGFLPDH